VQHIRDQLHLIWAEKIALVLASLILGLTVFFWAVVAVAAGIAGANHVLAMTGVSWVEDGLIGVAILWVLFRAIDYAHGGSTHALLSPHPVRKQDGRALPMASDLAHHHL
jgi:hypothetical protein